MKNRRPVNSPTNTDSLSPEDANNLLVNNLEDIILLINKELQLVKVPELAKKKIEGFYGIAVIPGMNILDFVEPDRRDDLQKIYQDVFNGIERASEVETLLNGKKYVFETKFKPAHNDKGEIVAALVITRDVTSSRKAVTELQAIEERWRFAIEGAKQGVWDWNMKTGDIFYSRSYKKMYGYSDGELEGRIEEWEKMIHPDDREIVQQAMQEHGKSPDNYYESVYRIRDKKGDYRWVLAKGNIISRDSEGTPLRMIGTHTDITEQINTEHQYRSLFNHNPLPCWIYDKETLRFLEVNKAAIEEYGYSEEEFLSSDVYLLHASTEEANLKEAIRQSSQQPSLSIAAWPHRKKDGTLIYADLSVNTIDYAGKEARLVVANNVTDKVLTEKALRKSNERFELAAKASSEALWEWNVLTNETYFSPAYTELFGWRADKDRRFEEWHDYIHPEDRRDTINDYYAALKNPETGYWSKEYRYLKSNGTYAYVIDKAIIIRDDQRKAVKVVGAIQDRTAQKTVEEELRKSNEIFRLVTRATSDAIYDFDLARNDIYWGEGLFTLFGYHSAELPYSRWRELVHPQDRERVLKSIEKAFKSYKTFWQEEYRFKRAKGGYSYVLDRGFILRDHNNEPVRMVGSMQDNTNRKYNEQLLSLERSIFELSANPNLEFREIVVALLNGFEEIHEEAMTSVVLLNGDQTIDPFVAPRVPREFSEGIRGLRIGPNEGSCGAAMALKEPVFVDNISTHPLWVNYKGFALEHGLKACWSLPIIHSSGKVMGSFAVYYKTVKSPSRQEVSTLERIKNILRVLMESNWALKQIKEANERFDIMMKATHDMIWDWNLETNMVYRDDLGLRKVYGVSSNDTIQAVEDWLVRIHPEDREKLETVINDILQATSQDVFEVEYRFLRDDGIYSDVYDRGIIVRNEDRRPVRMIGAAQDVTERKRLEKEILQNELERQKAINRATVDTQEQERTEIGKELHDNVNQVLTTTKLYLDLAMSNPELKDELIDKSNKNIIMVINEIRQLSRSLMDPSIGDLGLIDSINDLVSNINLTRKLFVQLAAPEEIECLLNKDHKLTVFRIIQEALNNAIRHAKATTVFIRFTTNKEFVQVSIKDDGIGFEPSSVKKGVGLKNIQNRIYLINGTHSIESAPGKGCKIIIRFPVLNKKIEQSN